MKKKEKHTITSADEKKTHIAFINIIKSLCVAAILNSTVFLFVVASFSLSLCCFLYVHSTLFYCCCAFFYCIMKATLPLLMFRIPMFFSSFSICFVFRFVLLLRELHASMCTKWHAFVVFEYKLMHNWENIRWARTLGLFEFCFGCRMF